MKSFPVLLETGGNQRYIFATNRLRENAGASNNIFEAGTSLAIEAVCEVFPDSRYTELQNSRTTREFLRKLDDASGFKDGHEIVLATSGKALLLTDSEDNARKLVTSATRKALEKFPGLVLTGAIGEAIEIDTASVEEMSKRIRLLHEQTNAIRARLVPGEVLFPMRPFLQLCHSSGLPAQVLLKEHSKGDEHAYSSVVAAKRGDDLKSRPWFDRISADLKEQQLKFELAMSMEPLERNKALEGFEALDWLAIVHADGNGFGKYFLEFGEHAKSAGASNAREMLDLYRRFSGALEICGLKAFADAVSKISETSVRIEGKARKIYPLVPIILGGDDLTVVMDGRQSLKFTEAYLKAFENVTAEKDLGLYGDAANKNRDPVEMNAIRLVTGRAELGAAAGVAIVKRHFPFHRGYELAEALLSSAKQTKVKLGGPAVSAMDFHMLFDGGATDLEDIRAKLRTSDAVLTHKPYIVSESDRVQNSIEAAEKKKPEDKIGLEPAWADLRYLKDLRKIIDGLKPGNGLPPVPNTQLHVLRDALFQGVEIANARFGQISHRYRNIAFSSKKDGKLYADLGDDQYSTMLIDLIELIDLEGRPEEDADDTAKGEAA